MSRSERNRNEPSLKPIGAALAAVVAGLGAAERAQAVETRVAPTAEPSTRERTHYVDPTSNPSFGMEEPLLLDTLAEPLGEKVTPKTAQSGQADLFDPNVPLSRRG